MPHSTSSWLDRKCLTIYLLLGLLFSAVILLNDGFIATDEYWTGIYRYIPAQKAALHTLVTPDDVKSPAQIMPMMGLAKMALASGIENPYYQYRFVIFGVGLINFILMLLCAHLFSQFYNHSLREKNFTLLLFGFYFASSFGLTRPMFESLALPWVTLAALYALKYEVSESRKDLFWGVTWASLTFVLRQQLGFCALTFVLWPLLKKRWADFAFVSGLGVFYFILAGIPDLLLRGQFHFSLIHLIGYNVEHGADYGKMPITFYPSMILAMTFFPFFIAKYPVGFLKNTFSKQKSLWIFLGLFVFLHSLFPQKWERFLISMILILLMIVEPYLFQLHSEFQFRKKRLLSLYTLNFVLFVIASFFPSQKNIISLALFLGKNPQIDELYRVNENPEWFADVFIAERGPYKIIDIKSSELTQLTQLNCHQAIVISEPDALKNSTGLIAFRLLEKLNVNLLEQLAFKLNPKNNNRRVQLQIYGCKSENT